MMKIIKHKFINFHKLIDNIKAILILKPIYHINYNKCLKKMNKKIIKKRIKFKKNNSRNQLIINYRKQIIIFKIKLCKIK